MVKRISILLIVLIFQHPSFGQNKHLIDSIISGLKGGKKDTSRVKTLNYYAYDYLGKDPNAAIYFGNEALNLAKIWIIKWVWQKRFYKWVPVK